MAKRRRDTASGMAGPPDPADQAALARAWRRLGWGATAVAVITSPGLLLALHGSTDLPWWACALITLFAIAAFRGLVDVLCFRFIARPSLYAADDRVKAEDAVFRRRRWYWRGKLRRLPIYLLLVIGLIAAGRAIGDSLPTDQRSQYIISLLFTVVQLPLFFLINFAIFFGPLLMFGVMQMKAFEPGDADWGVKLSDVRGQQEPKADVERVITLWSGGEDFRAAGGKPERGLLLIGAPGTGKTMLSKAIATSFNSPIMTMPGSGFAQTFIGLDVVMVMILVGRAKRLARKWGGQCMVFIDEIDAVGRRRQGLGGMAGATLPSTAPEDHLFYGPMGSLSASGDLLCETRAWRERLFRARGELEGPKVVAPVPDVIKRAAFPGGMGGMMGGGGMALNQLLVQMDGMDSPPPVRKWLTKKVNTVLDAAYVVPQRIGGRRLRLKPPKPRQEQVYFIGATNVDIAELDPALLRPGRMGRHIHFHTPTATDREDIFDLYLGRVAHDPDLDRPARRDELARITHGYSPAMIEQVTSMALTYAHADGRPTFAWQDIIEAMTTIESGTAIGVEYVAEESRAVAIHEAGHAVASHVFVDGVMSTRLSIRMRGGSLGHHATMKTEERFSAWRHEEVGDLIWTLGAMAAEQVFYGESSRGVGGDLQSVTTRAAMMVGLSGMGPEPVDLSDHPFASDEERREAEQACLERFERIGAGILSRSRSNAGLGDDAIGNILGARDKHRAAAVIVGQAYLTAYCLIRHNREQVARIADALVARQEMHGDEVVRMLDAAGLEAPTIDLTDEASWAGPMSEPEPRAPSLFQRPERLDPRERPRDPAGAYPRHAPEDLLPAEPGPAPAPEPAPTEAPAAPATAAAAVPPKRPAPQAARFQFVAGGLGAIALVGIVALALILFDSGDRAEVVHVRAWSSWAPRPGAGDGPSQIATHVGAEYKSITGRQLVVAQGGPLRVQGLDLTVAVREAAARGGQIKTNDSSGVLFTLCGLGGKSCAITSGADTPQRRLLLRREALELALYSFQYVDGVDQAVVVLPPAKAATASTPPQLLYFRRSDVQPALDKPLRDTLSLRTPNPRTIGSSPDKGLVTRETTPQFTFTFSPSSTSGRAFLVLDPVG